MAKFDRTYRQKVIDEYLNATGENTFVPAAFIDWLRDQPDHRVYPVFFGKSDEDAAAEYRINLARQFVSGLRVKIRLTATTIDESGREVKVTESAVTAVRVPAFYSPLSERKGGGGYHAFDSEDPAALRELRRQAATDLRRFIHRHEGIAKLSGISLEAIKAIAASFDALDVSEAA
jgi:hypothetical protein